MEQFVQGALSVAGKLVTVEGEIEIKVDGESQFLLQRDRAVVSELLPQGLVILTNLRIAAIVLEGGKRVVWVFNLSNVGLVEDCATWLRKSCRIRIFLKTLADGREIGIRFGSSTQKLEFLEQIQKQLLKKSWEHLVSLQKKESTGKAFASSTFNAGVSGLMRRQERDMNSVDCLAKEALTDLDALMRSAKDVVVIVQRFAALAQERDADKIGSDTTSEMGEVNEMEKILQNIGIISPVTKFSAGRMYHKELSRQLTDVLLTDNRLQRMGGIASLTDLYCLFNRARGTELVSPDDFLRACQLVGSLGAGIKCKRFESGVLSLQLESMDDSFVCRRILDILSEEEFGAMGVDSSKIANRLNTTVVIAKEQLLMAERSGVLCRDQSIDGLYFFPNHFNKFFVDIQKDAVSPEKEEILDYSDV